MFFDDPEENIDEEYEEFLEELNSFDDKEDYPQPEEEIANFCNCKNPSIKKVFISRFTGEIKVCRKCKKEVDDLPF